MQACRNEARASPDRDKRLIAVPGTCIDIYSALKCRRNLNLININQYHIIPQSNQIRRNSIDFCDRLSTCIFKGCGRAVMQGYLYNLPKCTDSVASPVHLNHLLK